MKYKGIIKLVVPVILTLLCVSITNAGWLSLLTKAGKVSKKVDIDIPKIRVDLPIKVPIKGVGDK